MASNPNSGGTASVNRYEGFNADGQIIHFACPGFIDLLGAADRIVGHLSKFILGITDRYLAREDTRSSLRRSSTTAVIRGLKAAPKAARPSHACAVPRQAG
jgi:hypothetical protein